ncbi:hypothetical protein MMC07_000410 [Pseudocyphellaria aurata]|nr:hypothetical protein [Pseudocyphellaria aurata]
MFVACRNEIARFKNTELCRLTEQVIFTDPYYAAPVNRHTSPQLDDLADAFRNDAPAKAAAACLKLNALHHVDWRACWQAKFCEQHQALLHGDLHTGSLMVTPSSTWMIDAEFAYYGPIAFDVCKLIANLLIAFLAADGLATEDEPRTEQRLWLFQVCNIDD